MEILDKLFEKVNGGYFCIIAVLSMLVLSTIGIALYLPIDPSFGIFTNYMSDLGAGPAEVKLIMLLIGIVGGILLVLVVLFMGTDLVRKNEDPILIKIVVILGLLAAFWFILIGIFPYDPLLIFSFEAHNISAVFCSYSLAATLFIYAFIEYKKNDMLSFLALTTFLTSVIFGVWVTGFTIVIYTPVPPQPFTYAIEWVSFFSLFIWLIVHGIYFIREK